MDSKKLLQIESTVNFIGATFEVRVESKAYARRSSESCYGMI